MGSQEEVEGETDKVNTLETKAKATFVSLLKYMGEMFSPYPVRGPTTWTILQKDRPDHLGLRYNELPDASNGPNHLGLCALQESEISVILGEGILNPCLVDEIYMGVIMQCSNNDTVRDRTTRTVPSARWP